MEKTTLLIFSALLLCLCSLHLPWISDLSAGGFPRVSETVVTERVEYWYWSFMAKAVTYHGYNSGSVYGIESYLVFDQLWAPLSGDPPSIGSLIIYQIGMNRPLKDLWEGYYVLFLFQVLTVVFLSISLFVRIVAENYVTTFKRSALYVITFLISLGALIVGVNQFVQDWGSERGLTLGHVGGRSLVRFDIGFYLAVASSILTLAYAVSFLVKVSRSKP